MQPKSQSEIMQPSEINQLIKDTNVDTNEISDGYHTFGELYDHRNLLYILLSKYLKRIFYLDGTVWRSKYHSDGSEIKGWFILGVGQKKDSQISYHVPADLWDVCQFAIELDRAPEFDGHTSQDVLKRLKALL